MYIEQGIFEDNKFWKYLIGLTVVIIGQTLGQIPFLIAIYYKTVVQDKMIFPTDDKLMLKILDSNYTLFLITLSFVITLFALFFVVKKVHNQSILSLTTSRKKMDWKRILFSFSIWAIISISTTYISFLINPEFFVVNFKLIPFLILFVIALIMIPIQTSCEEFIFRAYLMQGFGELFRNKWMPLISTSLVFGLLHIANPEVDKMGNVILIYYIGTGFFLGITTLMDEGIELSLGFHAANNLIGVLLVTADWTVFQTNSILIDKSEPDVLYGILIPVFIIYPILLFLFSKKYSWNNWNEKLTGSISDFQNIEIEKLGNNEIEDSRKPIKK